MPPPLRVLLDASSLPERPAGAGVYMVQLASALAARDSLEVTAAAPVPLVGCGWHRVSQGGPATRFRWELRELGAAVAATDAQVLHGLHFFTPRTLSVPRVTTVHDLTFFRIPRRYSLQKRAYYGAIARTLRWAERVIVPSSAVATDVVRYLGLPPARIRVVPEAPRTGLRAATPQEVAQFRREHGTEGRYLACLGTTEPGKRTVDAIRALPEIVQAAGDVSLVVGGNPGPLTAALEREAERLGVRGRVHFVGYIPDARLPAFLTGAEALVFPSLFEGFGLPPLEAMACGTPVISSRASAMDEMLGDAALFVPTRSPGEIARQAIRLLCDSSLHSEVAQRGLEQARQFTWARAAELTEEVYREVAG
jgi:glycosyltransferase involved in cell wall biosynthesis